jgi:hypothetical protein
VSAPVRFLALTVAGWTLIRLTALGAISGFTLGYAKPARLPPPVPSQLASLPVANPPETQPYPYGAYAPAAYSMPQVIQMRVPVPYYVPVYVSAPTPSEAAPIAPRPAWHLPNSSSVFDLGDYPSLPAPEENLLALAGASHGGAISEPAVVGPLPSETKLKRWQLSSWAFLRGPTVADSLATAGQLGGSQAGARLLYNFNRSIAASLRLTSPIGASTGAELAGGVRWIPLRSIPIAITAERRQSISRLGGRSDFALFAEGGLYRRPIPLRLYLNGYFQAGIVGVSRRDLFIDGAATVGRPLFGRISAGFGVWGGAQPGVARLDVGPRISLHVRRNVYAHFDWRQRLAGSAQPNSGPAVTLAADF